MARVTWRGVTVDDRTRNMLNEVARLTPNIPTLRPSQGSYTTAVGASAGTHAGGGAVDIRASNLTASQAKETVRVMRSVGFAAWRRLPSEGPWPEHIHAIAIGCPDLSPAAERQVTAYRNGRNGLANNGPDTGPRVGVVTWEQYLKQQRSWLDMASKGDVKDAIREVLREPLVVSVDAAAEDGEPNWSLPYTVQRLWHLIHQQLRHEIESVDGNDWSLAYTAERIWKRLHTNVWGGLQALAEMVEAQEPLLQAAAEGRQLTEDEIQKIAANVSRLRVELRIDDPAV